MNGYAGCAPDFSELITKPNKHTAVCGVECYGFGRTCKDGKGW